MILKTNFDFYTIEMSYQPEKEIANPIEVFYKNGLIHNEHGPAIIIGSSHEFYFSDGKLTKNQVNRISKDFPYQTHYFYKNNENNKALSLTKLKEKCDSLTSIQDLIYFIISSSALSSIDQPSIKVFEEATSPYIGKTIFDKNQPRVGSYRKANINPHSEEILVTKKDHLYPHIDIWQYKDLYHRADGPAVIQYNYKGLVLEKEYWLEGNLVFEDLSEEDK